MATRRLLICATALIALAGQAEAQVATSSGSRVVMDPDTRQTQIVNPTLDGRADDYAPTVADQPPIILRKPRLHKPKPAAPKIVGENPPSAQTQSPDIGYISPYETPMPAPAPAPNKIASKPKAEPKAKTSPAPSGPKGAAIPFSFSGTDNYIGPPPAKPQAQAVTTPRPSPVKPQTQAIATPRPAKAAVTTGSGIGPVRNIHIDFPAGVAEPSPQVASALQSLAPDLMNELQSGSERLLLQAFAGPPGDKSSNARRLSLKRALAVRQLLIDSGVPSDRIDVRAMGGANDSGKPDRVDVMVHK